MGNDSAEEAREGLVDNLKGRAKEVAGAVTGRDDLVEEGQLQQAEARQRKDAVSDQALADAKRDEAAQDVAAAEDEAAHDRTEARDRARQEESEAERQRAREHEEADDRAEQQAEVGRELAEREAEKVAERRLHQAERTEAAAAATERDSIDEATRLEREAATAEQQAAKLRAETE